MFVEINFRDIYFRKIRDFWQVRKKLSARIFFLFFYLLSCNKSLILHFKIFNYEFSRYIFDDFAKNFFFTAIIILRINNTDLPSVEISPREIIKIYHQQKQIFAIYEKFPPAKMFLRKN